MKKVLITGTFDLIHPGHISLIKQARNLGSVVAVVARDSTIRKHKGEAPFHSEQERKTQLEKLELVDQVQLGNEGNPYDILENIRPDIFLQGYDQKVFINQLETEIKKRNLPTIIKKAEGFYPEYFKSGKIKKVLRDETAGFLFIHKKQNWTSHDVIAKLRGQLKMKRIGHAGTLDPLATGLLILGVGKATTLLDWWHFFPKTYIADLEFGKTSNTYDVEGEVKKYSLNEVNETVVESISKTTLDQALQSFQGTQLQTPPAFSAKKINGKKAYDLARKGQEVKLKPKEVTIHEIELLAYTHPLAKLSITCSTGTYIRSIIHDLGQQLGAGAIMTALKRTSIGHITDQESLPLAQVMPEALPQFLYSPKELLAKINQYFIEHKA